MSTPDHLMAFERRMHELLEQQVRSTSGRVRSRLTEARHAALAGAADRRALWRWRFTSRRVWLPLAGATASVVAVMMVLGSRHGVMPPFAVSRAVRTPQDMALLTDRDGLALVREGDGQFYEWAAVQAHSVQVPDVPAGEPRKHGG